MLESRIHRFSRLSRITAAGLACTWQYCAHPPGGGRDLRTPSPAFESRPDSAPRATINQRPYASLYWDLLIRLASSLKPIFHNQGCTIMEEREPLMDQYGIRTRLNVEGKTIKFEIVLEGRVRLDPPSPEDTVCAVPCLTLVDMACSKLLANSDRWNDDGVFSRDLLDLAHLPLKPNQLINALSKAEGAYGESVQKDLIESLERLLGRAGWLERCRQALKIEEPKAVLWQKLIGLKRQLPV